jgi:signal transduction histidine kinase/CheY-like chemotaxis protein
MESAPVQTADQSIQDPPTGVTLEQLSSILEMVASGAPLTQVLHAITTLVEQQSSDDLCSILLTSPDGLRLHHAAGPSLPAEYNAAIDGAAVGPSAGSCGTAAFNRALVIVDDIATDSRWAQYKHLALPHGLRACWSMPIHSRDGRRVLGTVANYSRHPGPPTEHSLRLLRTAAHVARIAIEQANADARRKHAEKLLVAEAAVSRVLASAENEQHAMPLLLEAICATCDWETGAYWEVDESASLLRCRQFRASPAAHVDEFRLASQAASFATGQGLPGRVWAAAKPQWITDVREDPNFPRKAIAARAGLRAALGFPVVMNARVIGVLEFFTRELREPDAQFDAMLCALGGQIGQFIHRHRADEQLKAARDSAEKANRAKDRFLAMLSHELRTPLSPALLIATSMAEDHNLPADARDDARTIQRNIQLQTRLIDDLLDLSRIENAKLALQLEPLDLHDLLRDCLLICDADAKARGILVASDLAARRHVVSGDPFRLRQVFCNLLKNAIKFTPGGGSVTLRTADAEHAAVHVTVTDTGLGAPPDVVLKMFDPFEQGGRAKESQGLGLGLTICKGFVEAHGGTIAAHSDGPGRGMTLTVRLATLADAPAPAPRHDRGGATPSHRPLSILLVDDHPDTLRAMSRLLRRLEHRVVTANCVRSALDAAQDNDFDLLISDLGLPDGHGTALMKELVKRRPLKGIALTGYGTESDILQTREAGFFAHLTKPIDLDQLRNAILQTAHTD